MRRVSFLVSMLGIIVLASLSSGAAASVPLTAKTLSSPKACVLSANPASSVVAIDSFVQQASPGTNSGSATTMNVTSSNLANRRVHVRFDLTKCSPAISPSATVVDATLRLFATAVPSSCRTQDVFRVTATWTESAITWTNQPFGASANNPAQSARTSSINVGSAPCTYSTANQYVAWAVTADVASFVSGALTNYGWMIRDDAENSGIARASTYSTKNLGTLAQAPQLIITFTA